MIVDHWLLTTDYRLLAIILSSNAHLLLHVHGQGPINGVPSALSFDVTSQRALGVEENLPLGFGYTELHAGLCASLK